MSNILNGRMQCVEYRHMCVEYVCRRYQCPFCVLQSQNKATCFAVAHTHACTHARTQTNTDACTHERTRTHTITHSKHQRTHAPNPHRHTHTIHTAIHVITHRNTNSHTLSHLHVHPHSRARPLDSIGNSRVFTLLLTLHLLSLDHILLLMRVKCR